MICIVSACVSEMKHFIQLTNAEEMKGFSDRWAIDTERESIICGISGVGYLQSAINLQKILYDFPHISRVIFAGTAGVYPQVASLEPGQIIACKDVILCDGAAEESLAMYVSVLYRGPIATSFSFHLSEVEEVRVLTALSLTLENTLANKIAQQNEGRVENMELFGIAQVCREHHIPWNALLGITNFVGANGHHEWVKNHSKVEKQVGNLLYKFVRSSEQVT